MTIHVVGDGALERTNHHIDVRYGWVYVQRLLLEKILHRRSRIGRWQQAEVAAFSFFFGVVVSLTTTLAFRAAPTLTAFGTDTLIVQIHRLERAAIPARYIFF